MRRLNPIFYILFLLIITGAFAAFAQNNYGIDILVWTVAAFSVLCVVAAIITLISRKRNLIAGLEFILLAGIFSIVALRILLIYFQNVELLFAILSVALAGIYVYHLVNMPRIDNSARRTTFLFYSGIILFTITLAINAFSSVTADVTGTLGFIFFVVGFIIARRIKEVNFNGRDISIVRFLTLQPNQSILLVSLFVMLSIYTAGNKIDLFPEIHSTAMPEGYYKLVEHDEANAKVQSGTTQDYQLYQNKLESFIKKYGQKE